MELILVRHGQPALSSDGRSVDDPGLTEVGHAQAERTAARLAELGVDELLVSPLRRARETCAPIASMLGIEARVLPWLAEIAAPSLEGSPIEEAERFFVDARHRPHDEHWEGLPGGESFRAFHDRVTTGLRSFLASRGATPIEERPALWHLDAPGRVAMVAHWGTNATALGHLLGIDPVPWEWERFALDHASITHLEPVELAGARVYRLDRLSDVAHLPTDLRTR